MCRDAEADVVDEEGKSVAPGVGGRLVLKRPFPYMLRTVWGDPARYERDWQVIPGCYMTGDVALKDKDGYITVLGRADDVLNVAGHRIGTAEVESALVSHPAVAEAAAIGIPDKLKGETIKVSCKCRGNTLASETSGSRTDRARAPGTWADRHAFSLSNSWPRCPRLAPGKILRRFLKAKELGLDAGDVSTMEG